MVNLLKVLFMGNLGVIEILLILGVLALFIVVPIVIVFVINRKSGGQDKDS